MRLSIFIPLFFFIQINTDILAQDSSVVNNIIQQSIYSNSSYLSNNYQQKFQQEEIKIQLLNQLVNHYQSPVEHIRFNAFQLTDDIGKTTKNTTTKLQALEYLITATKDSSATIRDYYSRRLVNYEKATFTPAIIQQVKSVLRDTRYVNRYLIKLSGYLNLQEEIPYLKTLSSDSTTQNSPYQTDYPSSIRWATQLALARMGEISPMKAILQRVAESSDLQIVGRLFPDLAYVQQPATTQIIIDYLNSNGLLIATAEEKERYANRALGQLARILVDFPITPTRSAMYTWEQVLTARQWVNEQQGNFIYRTDVF